MEYSWAEILNILLTKKNFRNGEEGEFYSFIAG